MFKFLENNTAMVTENEEEFIIETLNEEDVFDNNIIDDDIINEELTKKRNPEIITSQMHGIKKIKLSSKSIQPEVQADVENANIDKNIHKPSTSKKVFKGLQLLTSKHLKIAEGKDTVLEDLNSLSYKKYKL